MDEWKPSARMRAFLAAYRLTASVTKAAKAAGIGREAHYRALERSPGYKAAFEQAALIAADAIEDEAIRRAREGVLKPLFYHGELVYMPQDPGDPKCKTQVPVFEREYSDTLLLALLRAKKPGEYRDRLSAELTGKDGGPIDTRLEIVFVDAPSDASRIPEDPPPAV
jgi:hypothetical protein